MNFTYIPLQMYLQGEVCSQVGVSIGKTIHLGEQTGHQTTHLLELLDSKSNRRVLRKLCPSQSHLYSPPGKSHQHLLLQIKPRQTPLGPSNKQQLLRPST